MRGITIGTTLTTEMTWYRNFHGVIIRGRGWAVGWHLRSVRYTRSDTWLYRRTAWERIIFSPHQAMHFILSEIEPRISPPPPPPPPPLPRLPPHSRRLVCQAPKGERFNLFGRKSRTDIVVVSDVLAVSSMIHPHSLSELPILRKLVRLMALILPCISK